MITYHKTISVAPIEDHAAYVISWPSLPQEHDVRDAFKRLVHHLDFAKGQVDVINDLTQNPSFPVQAVISEVLSGPHKHPNMGEWLCVGTNRLSRVIATVLTAISERTNIRWFKTYDEAIKYLRSK
jgi:hypothetical protein